MSSYWVDSEDVTLGQLSLVDVPIPSVDFGNFISSWLLQDRRREQTLLVETGPAVSAPALQQALSERGIEKIDYLLCTHIHLDHTGGVGHFLQQHPETQVIVSERGKKHLVAPDRLWEGSLQVLGEVAELYSQPLPVDEGRIISYSELPEGVMRLSTPGHAPHHDAYLYTLSDLQILFIGDAAGVCLALKDGTPYQRPTTPPRFYYQQARESLLSALQLDADLICFPHYGAYSKPSVILKGALQQLDLWQEWIEAHKKRGMLPEDTLEMLLEKDPALRHIDDLPGGEPQRERRFILQSISGFWNVDE